MSRHDEPSCRRPEFAPGVPVVLADGQAWELARPFVRFHYKPGPERFERRLTLDGADGYGKLLTAYEATESAPEDETLETRAERVATRLGLMLAIGRELLVRNYSLTDADVAELMPMTGDKEDVVGRRITSEVMAVAMGDSPKPSPDGDESSPSPAGQ